MAERALLNYNLKKKNRFYLEVMCCLLLKDKYLNSGVWSLYK